MGESPEALERRRERDRRRAKAKNKAYYEKNKEREKARCRTYHQTEHDKRLAVKAEWRAANRVRENAKFVCRRHNNLAEYRERDRLRRESGVDAAYRREWNKRNAVYVLERNRKWNRENLPRLRAKGAARRAAKMRATPKWADLAQIAAIYAECERISKDNGIPHEVDHIFPLKGKTLCGLHVPENLQIIPRRQNRSKGNRLIEATHEPFWATNNASAEREVGID